MTADKSKTKTQLIEELGQLRQRIFELEGGAPETSLLGHDISQTIIDTSPAFFVIIDFAGKTKMMNRSMLEALGYSEEEVQGKDYLSTFVTERDRDSLSRLFQKELLKGKSTINQNHILTKDGQELFCEWQGRPLPGPQGKVELFCGVGLDITERKRAEEILEQSEQRYRLLIENIPSVAWITARDGKTIFISDNVEKVYGYTSDEILSGGSELWFDRIYPDDKDKVQEAFEKLFSKQEQYKVEYRIQKKEGEWIWLYDRANIVEGVDNLQLAYGVFSDITERKQMEDEQKRLTEAERKHHLELQKLREISANMRKAEGSQDLIQVFTKEVQKLCQADLASSTLFKENRKPVTFFAPGTNSNLSDEQSEAISKTLSDMEIGNVTTRVPGFASMLLLPLQSLDNVHGAVLVASREQDAFTDDQKNLLNATADMAGTALNRIDIWETLEDRVRQRTRNLVVLYNLITIISENWRLHDLLELSLVLTLETTNADRGIIYLKDEKDFSTLRPIIQRGFPNDFQFEVASLPDYKLARDVFEKQKPLALNNLADNPAFAKFKEMTSYAGIPITARGDARGVFSLFSNGRDAFGDEEMALLASIADHLGIGIDNSVLYEQSRESAALEERNRLARDLHDAVSQLLYSMTLMAGTTRKMLERGSDLDAVQLSVERLEETAHRALKEMRLLLFELRPAVLDSEGLVGALQHRIKSVEDGLGVSVELQAQGLPELPSNMEDALYHIAMEALNNIIKHAESKTALIKFSVNAGILVMEISDDGKGFDTDLLQKGSGLRNMRERGQMLGSEVVVDSKTGQGTRVAVEVKLPSESKVSSNEVFNG